MPYQGLKRAIKFRLGQCSNPAYEALINDPMICVIKEHVYNSFEELFVTVWFYDRNDPPFNPYDHVPQDSGGDAEEADSDGVPD